MPSRDWFFSQGIASNNNRLVDYRSTCNRPCRTMFDKLCTMLGFGSDSTQTLGINVPNGESYGNLGKRLVSGRGYNYNYDYANGGDGASATHSIDGDGGSTRLVPALSGIVIPKGHHTVAPKDLAGQGLCGEDVLCAQIHTHKVIHID